MDVLRDALEAVLSFSSDAFVIAALIALGGVYTHIKGKKYGISLILCFYPSILIFTRLPFFREYTANNPASSAEALTQAVIFLAIFIFIHLILNKFISAEFSYSKIRKTAESLLLGFLTSGLLILCSYHIVNIELIYNFSSTIDRFFLGNYYFWWLFAPLVGIFLLKKY